MRQLVLAAGIVCAVAAAAHWATAQSNAVMPGQTVGTGFNFQTVGTQLPQFGTPVGQPLNMPADTPLVRRANLNRPFDAFKGTNLDPNNVVAPVIGLGNQNALEKLYDKVKAAAIRAAA